MAKAASPIRLQQSLMEAASETGARFHRSTAEQVEYWADLGRRISSAIDPDTLLSITSGLARIKVEPVHSAPIDPDALFEKLEQEREAGLLPSQITTASPRYQASLSHPGYLERIDAEGDLSIGQFHNGTFIPVDTATL